MVLQGVRARRVSGAVAEVVGFGGRAQAALAGGGGFAAASAPGVFGAGLRPLEVRWACGGPGGPVAGVAVGREVDPLVRGEARAPRHNPVPVPSRGPVRPGKRNAAWRRGGPAGVRPVSRRVWSGRR